MVLTTMSESAEKRFFAVKKFDLMLVMCCEIIFNVTHVYNKVKCE